MLLPRSSTLRASSVARLARPARNCRITELQPWQRVLQQSSRRTYATPSEHGHAAATRTSDLPWAVAAVLGTGVGLYTVINQDFGHGHHDDDHKAPLTSEQQNVSEEKREEKEASPEPNTKGEADESKKAPADPAEADPAEAGDSKVPKDSNTMSGKQQGLDNDDYRHTHPPENEDEKSKKGEGVAESAKLKGTVSTDRPPAENKEERGNKKMEKK